MGRKKKKTVKPWCWYCNREFDDDKVLTFHQKAKHFKCHICHKKLFSAPGLAIHCSQVHKESVSHVPNALGGRDNIEVEIFGMEGIPEADRIAHELQKTGKAYMGEPEAKRPKLVMGMPIGGPPAMMYHAVMPGMGPPPIMPGMHGPIMPGMVPPPGAALMPPRPPMGHAIPPQPLFPSGAQPLPVGQGPPPQGGGISGEPPKPAFPAYQNADQPIGLPEGPMRQASKVAPVGAGCKLMHPEDDISLEEIRSQLPKYRTVRGPGPDSGHRIPRPPQPPPNSSAPPFMGAGGPPVIRPGMLPPMMAPGTIIRPGMGPPPVRLPMGGPEGW